MVEFFGFLLGAKIGDKAASGVIIYFNFCKLLLSFFMWGLFGSMVIGSRSIGVKASGIAAVLLLIAGFCYCVYIIETRNIRCSHIFPKICFIVTTLLFALSIYADEGEVGGWFILIAILNIAGMLLPKKILQRVESMGKKSELVSTIEYRINKYKADKKKKNKQD